MVLEILATVTLVFTHPSETQRRWIDPSQGADSVMVECSGDGGDTLRALQKTRLYRQSVSGGPWQMIAEKSAVGLEGRPDSFVTDPGPGAHYHVRDINTAGESCPSNVVYVPGSVVTGVTDEPQGAGDKIVSVLTFDVRGRLVRSPTAAGVYWTRTRWKSGRVETKRVAILK